MVLSEAEAERQLAALRQEREKLDRTIAELTLFLDLGRRLTTTVGIGQATAETASPGPQSRSPIPGATTSQFATNLVAEPADDPVARAALLHRLGRENAATAPMKPVTRSDDPLTAAGAAPARSGGSGTAAPPVSPAGPPAADAPPRAGEAELSEGVVARRYGRALIAAALEALHAAGRPLHASEILAALSARGFALPGHDPVAALNTRLWKRSGAGGPLRRLGDAVYALAEDGTET